MIRKHYINKSSILHDIFIKIYILTVSWEFRKMFFYKCNFFKKYKNYLTFSICLYRIFEYLKLINAK